MASMARQKVNDNEVDRYLQESCKSYKECEIKNNARRNSLQKRTLGIETERKMASINMSREERQLREQLKQMKIEKAKNDMMHNMREMKGKTAVLPKYKTNPVIPTEPYPITFRADTPSPVDLDKQLEKSGRAYARNRRRRQSKEYEDLSLENTGSKALLSIDENSEYNGGLRRRVFSMSSAQRPTFKKSLSSSLSVGSNSSSPRTSPGLRRKLSSGQRGNNSTGSKESVTSMEDLHWIGDPEAIHSVRRPRKTVEDQELESELYKLTHSKSKS